MIEWLCRPYIKEEMIEEDDIDEVELAMLDEEGEDEESKGDFIDELENPNFEDEDLEGSGKPIKIEG